MSTEAAFDVSDLTVGASANSTWVVMKFGGSSVATFENWQKIAERIRQRCADGYKVLVVHSALKGVSDNLHAALALAETGSSDNDLVDAIESTHRQLADEFDVDVDATVGKFIEELRQLIAGVRLVREVTPRVAARVMALGELMSTALSVAWLQSEGIAAAWQDARELLPPAHQHEGRERKNFLTAACQVNPDPTLADSLAGDQVHVTQGFVARNAAHETVLLGRGGSDTSAAYFAVLLSACRLEIWTDVPGMFSADPRFVPAARLLKRLDYEEAQEIASTGGLVLHPRCIGPLRQHQIPLFVRCTPRPDLTGTTIGAMKRDPDPSVKAISLRQNITLLSLEGVVMWQEIGFLARVFSVFDQFRVSIDLVSTSESNVTVSIDPDGEVMDDGTMADLVAALSVHCRVDVIRNCAAVSLVGRKIRTHLHRIGPALAVFEEHKVHLLSQAANDLNLTVVVDQAQGYRLVQQLHPSIFGRRAADDDIGDTWESYQSRAKSAPSVPAWWREKSAELLSLMDSQSSCYVYDAETIQARVDALKALSNIDNVLFAMKANSNREILKLIHDSGLGFECVSPGELDRVFGLFPDLSPQRILYTPNFAPAEDYAIGFDRGVRVTLDNLHPLREWPEVFEGQEIFVRLDPGKGRGHHEHVKTAGVHSKFGVPLFELDLLESLTKAIACRVVGVHAHSGSGITQADSWQQVAEILADAATRFPDVRVLDLGGGLGVPEKPGDDVLDLMAFDASLASLKAQYPDKEFWLEPGRFLVAEAGVLLSRVTQTKGKGSVQYVGLATGMNSLIRPALYGAFHEIVNLSRIDEPADQTVTIVGPICESGDTLGNDRLLPAAQSGDVVLVANAGAYGFVMASDYNLRPKANEVFLT